MQKSLREKLFEAKFSLGSVDEISKIVEEHYKTNEHKCHNAECAVCMKQEPELPTNLQNSKSSARSHLPTRRQRTSPHRMARPSAATVINMQHNEREEYERGRAEMKQECIEATLNQTNSTQDNVDAHVGFQECRSLILKELRALN